MSRGRASFHGEIGLTRAKKTPRTRLPKAHDGLRVEEFRAGCRRRESTGFPAGIWASKLGLHGFTPPLLPFPQKEGGGARATPEGGPRMSLAAGRGWGQGLSLPFRSGARQGWLSLQLFTIFRSNKNFSPSSVATLSVRKVRPTTPTQRLAGVDGAARPQQPSAGFATGWSYSIYSVLY